jgi:Uma2 family endonuclease
MNRQAPTVRQPATYQDVLDAPPNMVAELIRGALHLQPRPASPHARASSVLGGRIGGPFDWNDGGPGGWWIIDEPELHFGPDVLVPDLAGWRRERMPSYPDVPFFELAPDWVCEVLSSSTRRVDVIDKRAIYGEAGVGHLWFVDPLARTLEAFALRDRAWVLLGARRDDEEVRLPPFEAVGFPLGRSGRTERWRDAAGGGMLAE